MKKIVAVLLAGLMLSTASQANPNMHHHGNRHYGNHTRIENWVAPLVIGSVVGYAIATRSQPPQPQVVYVPNNYPSVPYGYHWEQILDINCNCYRWVLVAN